MKEFTCITATFFLNKQTTNITNIITTSRLSAFSG